MKKFVTLALALVMVLALSITAFATDVPGAEKALGDYESGNVTVAVATASSDNATVYSVLIEWDSDLEFNFTPEGTSAWDPSTHTYPDAGDAAWTDTEATITVTNHSNVEVNVKAVFVKEDGAAVDVEVTGDATGEYGKNLTSGTETTFAEAANTEITVSVDDEAEPTAGATLGKVKITIAAAVQ